jgi:hypothetical protein
MLRKTSKSRIFPFPLLDNKTPGAASVYGNYAAAIFDKKMSGGDRHPADQGVRSIGTTLDTHPRDGLKGILYRSVCGDTPSRFATFVPFRRNPIVQYDPEPASVTTDQG